MGTPGQREEERHRALGRDAAFPWSRALTPLEVTPNASPGLRRSNPTRSRDGGHDGHLGLGDMMAIMEPWRQS